MSGALSNLGRQRALDAMLGTAAPEVAEDLTAEVELRASWSTPGRRWRGLFRRGWSGFLHPWPIPHSRTWRTQRQPIRLRRTVSGFENQDELRWDLLSVPPVPPRSAGWMPLAVNIYNGEELIFAVPIPVHRLLPSPAEPDDAAQFAPGAITLSVS